MFVGYGIGLLQFSSINFSIAPVATEISNLQSEPM